MVSRLLTSLVNGRLSYEPVVSDSSSHALLTVCMYVCLHWSFDTQISTVYTDLLVPSADVIHLKSRRLHMHVCVCSSVYLSVCVSLSICMSVCLSVCMYVRLSICLSVCVSLSICMSVCLSVCMSVCLSVCMSVCLSVCMSVCLCLCRVIVSRRSCCQSTWSSSSYLVSSWSLQLLLDKPVHQSS